MADELAFLSIRELARRIQRKDVSVQDVVRATLSRTERIDPVLNSYITTASERALEAAKERDAEIARGKYRGVFHGIPISVKDHIDTEGIPTTAGSKILRSRVPTVDAPIVRKLKQAGAIVIGKANMNQFAGGESGWNPDYGQIRNPWNLQFSVGGSSGGSAAQVAAGLVPLSIGSDNGGSIRIPAALCGVVGIKPTFGRVSMDGVAPRSFSMDHVGPLTRTVEDAAIALEVLSGPMPGSSTTFARPVPAFAAVLTGDARGLRVGVDRRYCQVGQPAVLEAFAAALAVLEGLGCTVRDLTMPSFEEVMNLNELIFQPEVGLWFDAFTKAHASEISADLREGLGQIESISAFMYLRAGQRRRELQIEFARQMQLVDVVALPTYFLAQRPFPQRSGIALGGYPNIGTYVPTDLDGLRYTIPFNLLGLPAVSVPCGVGVDGNVGLQIVGRAWDEATVLRAAHVFQNATEWHQRRPPEPGLASA